MFRVAHRSSSGTLNCIFSLWFIYPCGDRLLPRLNGKLPTQPRQWMVTTWVYKPEAANTVQSSWWWAVCRSKHVQPSINFGIINSITKLHLVGISTESSTMHGSMNIKLLNTFTWKFHFLDNLPFSLLLHADQASTASRSSIGSPEGASIRLIWDFIAMGSSASCPSPQHWKLNTCVCLIAHLKPDQTTTSTAS